MNAYLLQPSQAAPPPPGGGPMIPSQGPAPATGPSSSPQGGGSSMLIMLLAFLPVILFMWLTSRSQQKKQRELEAKLKKGDQVVTQSGIVGKLVEIEGRHARVEIAPGVKVQVLKSSIAGLDIDPAKSTPAPTGDKK